jgi:protein-S-isoprenylcysteine O-methyltransferase Ste14
MPVFRDLTGLRFPTCMLSSRNSNILLFVVNLVELILLLRLLATFTLVDWIYLGQHLLVLGISLTRRRPIAQDQSWSASLSVAIAYIYPYAQVLWLSSMEGQAEWPAVGTALVTLSTFLSLAALLSIGRLFGVRPALRGLATNGTYRLVRHPMYLAYFMGDIGYQLEEGNIGTLLIMAPGWASLVYRISAEEQMLSLHPDWVAYARSVPYRLVPGLW